MHVVAASLMHFCSHSLDRSMSSVLSAYMAGLSVAGGSGVGSQSMRSSGGSGTGHFSHGHKNSAGSNADWGSGNYSPSSAGGSSLGAVLGPLAILLLHQYFQSCSCYSGRHCRLLHVFAPESLDIVWLDQGSL